MTDSELKRFVEDALHHEVRLRGRDINVAVQDGTVILKGEVPDIAEKRLAINLVRRLREIGAVRDQLRLPTPQEMTDTRIENHIRDGWQADRNIHELQLSVTASDATAVLTGTVNSLEEKRLAGLVAWWVPGVANVDNQIRVDPEQEGDAADLIDSVRQALDKDVLVNADTVGVAARGATITLAGFVASEEERQAAEHDAYYVWGVENVINNLTISPR